MGWIQKKLRLWLRWLQGIDFGNELIYLVASLRNLRNCLLQKLTRSRDLEQALCLLDSNFPFIKKSGSTFPFGWKSGSTFPLEWYSGWIGEEAADGFMFELRTDSLSSLSSFRTDNRRDDLLFCDIEIFCLFWGISRIVKKCLVKKRRRWSKKKWMMLTWSNVCTNGVLAFLPMNHKAFEWGRKCEGTKERTERVVGKASGW